jgi:RNA polymerase sigma-70 factor (ECF subfamily)
MTSQSERDQSAIRSPALFATTHWSIVLAAGHSSLPGARDALEKLACAYWYPLYAFTRRQSYNPHDAQDLTQAFFASLLENRGLCVADPARGRFRSFLLVMLKGFMSNEWDRTNRQKRGGGVQIVSLNADDTEIRYLAEPIDEMTPEKAYDRRWATLRAGRIPSTIPRSGSPTSSCRDLPKLFSSNPPPSGFF